MRRLTGGTDWRAIRTLYEALFVRTGSPVVALNRAVAIGRTDGAAAGLQALDEISVDDRIAAYQPYWAACADLRSRAGDAAGAGDAFERAAGLTIDPAIRAHLARRARQCRTVSDGGDEPLDTGKR